MRKAFFALAAALPFILAVKNSTETFALLTKLPQCALTCLANAVANSTCTPTDTACVCTNVPLNAAVSVCVQSTCSVKQSLTTLNITHTICEDPIRDGRNSFDILSNVFGVTTGVAVVLRFYSRWKSAQEFWYDDYSIIAVMVLGIPGTVMNVQGLTYNGLGLDIWRVGFRQITDFIHVFFAMELLYFSQVGTVKLSILFFYLRLFPGPTIRRWTWATIIFNTIFTLVFIFVGLFQCTPLSFYWKSWDNEHEGKCMNLNALVWANAGISIALDFWMLALPMTQLMNLSLHWKKKLSVAAMFGVGAFVTIVSVVRLRSLVKVSNTQNPTWDYLPVAYWSTIEINVGIICACMPSIRLLLVRAFPRFMGTTRDGSYVYSTHRSGDNKIPGNGSTSRSGSGLGGSRGGSSSSGSGSGSANRTRLGGGSSGAGAGGVTLSSKSPNDEDVVRTSTLELVKVERVVDLEGERQGRGREHGREYRHGQGGRGRERGLEPDYERRVHKGNWV
ncbi:hypothetical protein ONS96_003722 [Cadophora gregata f. sp. sojae]|nr:hypothetical protein ONS96_003722 [Cadophora gregata f. sp. sojae]